MKRWLKPLFLLLGLVTVSTVSAHENTPPEIPSVTQRCVSIENNLPDDWTFEGTIVTFRQGDGLHGFRADIPSRYYIAFDGGRQYAGSGVFSPDGQWFAYFAGGRQRANWVDYHFYSTQIIITSTHPRRETYVFPFSSFQLYSSYARFFSPLWLDNTKFALFDGEGINDEGQIIRPFAGISETITYDQFSQVAETAVISPAVSDVIWSTRYSKMPENPPDHFVFLNGRPLYTQTLYITDPETHQVYDTCITLSDERFAVSPSGDQIAVGIGDEDGFVYVFDLNEWTAYRLDLAANAVVGWFADP